MVLGMRNHGGSGDEAKDVSILQRHASNIQRQNAKDGVAGGGGRRRRRRRKLFGRREEEGGGGGGIEGVDGGVYEAADGDGNAVDESLRGERREEEREGDGVEAEDGGVGE